MDLNVLILPGDGIGTEVTREAVKVLGRVCEKYKHKLNQREALLGGIAIHKTGGTARERLARNSQNARCLREPAAGANIQGFDSFFAAEERVG